MYLNDDGTVDWNSVHNACHDGELIQLNELPDFNNTNEEVWQGAELALIRTGDTYCSLYDRSGNEIWIRWY